MPSRTAYRTKSAVLWQPSFAIRRERHASTSEELSSQAPQVQATISFSKVAGGSGSATLKISVIDNGVGIAPENMPLLFNRGLTTKKSGHGFGLHTSLLAAKELLASLCAASEGPGRGAMFTLELPTTTKDN